MVEEFKIIFDELAKKRGTCFDAELEGLGTVNVTVPDALVAEIDEISELRKIVCDTMDADPVSFTTT